MSRQLKRVGASFRLREIPSYGAILRGDPCGYCGGAGGTVDHVVALAAGGVNAPWNLTASCALCNREKGKDSLLSFLAYRAGLGRLRFSPPRRRPLTVPLGAYWPNGWGG